MNFHINDFDGPLDLLLHLVKQSKMDIYEIQISQIIEQYLDLIHKMQDLNIDMASSYLVMAADLLHLKSKLLINQPDEEEQLTFEFETEEDLRQKLIEYHKYKEITKDFIKLSEKRNEVYTKDPANLNEYFEDKVLVNDSITLDDLVEAFLNFKKREELLNPIETKITKKEISVSERTNSIRSLLSLKSKVKFTELFETYTKDYVVVTFLSILDMSKNNEIILSQEKTFGDILIEKRV